MWKICVDHPYKNVEKIFPTQQQDVGRVVEEWKKDDNIKKIIVFGSSVTSACNPWSDIDLYVEMGKKQKHPPTGVQDVALDIWTNFDVDDALLEEIKMKGVIVYERKRI